ncbi:MAG TPA: DUF2066 domain-containing protein, partial [Rhodospirillales bacterium]|nr:DUF2066 domain-containing protein [Rhodospirillales bacterium]
MVPFAMTDHRQSVKQLYSLVLFLGVVLPSGAAIAQSNVQSGGVFEVRGVQVDVTAASTSAARDKARAMAEAKAFRALLERLTMTRDHGRLPTFSASDLSSFVQDFEVAREKASAVRYLATLNYQFKARRIRDLLIDRQIPFAETVSKPVLILPLYRAAGAVSLWDDPNPWRAAWMAQPRFFSLVPTLLPVGDLADIAAIGPQQALAGDQARLSVISARYRTTNTFVALAVLKLARGRPELDVRVTRYGGEQPRQSVARTFQSAAGETLDQLLARAASGLTRQIEDNWKRDNLLQFGDRAVIAVTIPIKGLEDWLAVRRALGGVAVVRSTDLVILSLDEVRINLNYIGS